MWVDLWVFGLIPILFAALFVYLIARLICGLFRGLAWLLGFGESHSRSRRPIPHDRPGETSPGGVRTTSRICPNPRCRRANVAMANYCAQCGQRL